MRLFLADIGDLIGPLLLVLFAVAPRLFGKGKKKPKPKPRPAAPPPAYEPPEEPVYVEMEENTPPPSPEPAQELPELAEVLQEILGRKQYEPEPEPKLEPEPEPMPRPVSMEPQPLEPIRWDVHHGLKKSQISPADSSARRKRHRHLISGRESLRDIILLREILGPPRSLQPVEDWESGGS